MKKKLKALAVGMAASLMMLAGATSFVAADQNNAQLDGQKELSATAPAAVAACKRQSAANAAGQDIVVSTGDPVTYPNAGGAWQNVQCTATTFRLKFGERAIVVADVSAETDCNGTAPTNGQWCQARALLNGIEGSPAAPEPSSFAFDSFAGGAQNWQAHAFNRAWEVRCGLSNGCQYRFVVQTRMHHASVTGLWLDEVAAHLRINIGAPAPL